MTKEKLEIIAESIARVHPGAEAKVTQTCDGNFEVIVMCPVKAGVLRIIENNCSTSSAILKLDDAAKDAEKLAKRM